MRNWNISAEKDIVDFKKFLKKEFEFEEVNRMEVSIYLNEEIACLFPKDIDELDIKFGHNYFVQAIRFNKSTDYFDGKYIIIIADTSSY